MRECISHQHDDLMLLRLPPPANLQLYISLFFRSLLVLAKFPLLVESLFSCCFPLLHVKRIA